MTKKHIKDPGSADHTFYRHADGNFCGCPSFDKSRPRTGTPLSNSPYDLCRQSDPALCSEHNIPYRRYFRKSKHYFEKNRSYDDLCTDRRNIHADLSACTRPQDRNSASASCLGYRDRRNPDQSILGLLSEMVFIRIVYRHGVDLCSRIHSDSEHTVSGCIRMASGRRYHLHDRRYHLCTKTPDLQ